MRKLIAAAREEGSGRSYLIQHSAGSGKTNSISWLSHRLASLHDREDRKVFDCVVVITDRRVLDRQLQDAIYQIEHAQGVVKAIDRDSRQLAAALIDGTRIVVTTLQKFPFVLRGLLHAAGAESQEAATAGEKARAKAWKAEIAKRRKERACNSDVVVRTALANTLDRFEMGVRGLIEDLMIERMGENDRIVTRYVSDKEFQGSAFPVLAREIFETVRARRGGVDPGKAPSSPGSR